MADYAIGDLQGCYTPLLRLLDKIDFNDRQDRLWFVGDLVNRGPDSLAVLRFIKALPIPARISLGNHDLHLLASLFGHKPWRGHDDTILQVMQAPDGEELGHWLRQQAIVIYDEQLKLVMSHAGMPPIWTLEQALTLAQEIERVLAGDDYQFFLSHLYGNKPHFWSEEWIGLDRLRVITNYFTRMRFCDSEGHLQLSYKGTVEDAPTDLYPWYDVPGRKPIAVDIVFGHWAALGGTCPHPQIHAIDTGCLWGGTLTALRLQDKCRFSVPGQSE